MNTDKIARQVFPIAIVAIVAGVAMRVRKMLKGKLGKKKQASTSGDDDLDLDSYDLDSEEEANAAIEPVSYNTAQPSDEYDPNDVPPEAPPLPLPTTARPPISFVPSPVATVPPGFTIKPRKKLAAPAKK